MSGVPVREDAGEKKARAVAGFAETTGWLSGW
jgi:hypothetical protein